MTYDDALHFAREWIAAWNAKDLDAVLKHYSEDFTMASPYIQKIVAEPSGTLRGKAAVGAYWRQALDRYPQLHFDLEHVALGVNSAIVQYRSNVTNATVCELFSFGAEGQVERAHAHYESLG
jgi:ketosteroid isomerase-like protein